MVCSRDRQECPLGSLDWNASRRLLGNNSNNSTSNAQGRNESGIERRVGATTYICFILHLGLSRFCRNTCRLKYMIFMVIGPLCSGTFPFQAVFSSVIDEYSL
jgi:hypothetical protein